MKRIFIFSAPAALILGGYASIIAWRGQAAWPPPALARMEQTGAGQSPEEMKLDFVSKGALDYFDERGFRGSSQAFEFTDGVTVYMITERRDSVKEAGGALEEKLRKAIRIEERKPLSGRDGRQHGDRAVAYFSADAGGKERPALLRTDGSVFYYIESSSLPHLLLLEKRLFHRSQRPKEHPTPTGLRPGNGR